MCITDLLRIIIHLRVRLFNILVEECVLGISSYFQSGFLSAAIYASLCPSIQRGWLLVPCSPGQGLSPGDSSQLCSPIMPRIPQTCPGSLTCLLCGQAACQPGNQHPAQTAGRPSSPTFIHLSGWLMYPPGPEQGFSLGDSSRLCSPPSCLTFPSPALGPPSRHRALWGAQTSVRPHFPFSFWYYRSLTPTPSISATSPPPTPHLFFFLQL